MNFRETLKMHVTYKITLNLCRKGWAYHFNWMCTTICLSVYIQSIFVHPWDFPGKSTGVGCHRLLRSNPQVAIKNCFCNLCALCLVVQSGLTLCDPMDCSLPGSVCGDSSGKNSGVGCYATLQGIFSTQEKNPDIPHSRWIHYHQSHQRSPYGDL